MSPHTRIAEFRCTLLANVKYSAHVAFKAVIGVMSGGIFYIMYSWTI